MLRTQIVLACQSVFDLSLKRHTLRSKNFISYFFSVFALALLPFISAAESKGAGNSQPTNYYLFIIDFVTDSGIPALVGFYRLPLGEDAINDQSLFAQQFSIPDTVLNRIASLPSTKPTTCALAARKNKNSADVVICLSKTIEPLLQLLGIKSARHSLSNNDLSQNTTLPSGFTPKTDLGRLLSSGGGGGDDDDTPFTGFSPDMGKSIFDMPELVFDTYLMLAWLSKQLKLISSSLAWFSSSELNKPQAFCSSLPPTTKKCSQWLDEFEPDLLWMANSITPTKQDYLSLLYQQSEVITLYPVYSLPEGASASLVHRNDIAYIGEPCANCELSFSEHDEVILSPCGHLFHSRCLEGLNQCTTCSGDVSQLMPYLETEAMQEEEEALADRLTAYLKSQTNKLLAVNKISMAANKMLKASRYVKNIKSKPDDVDVAREFVSFIVTDLSDTQTENIERVIQGAAIQAPNGKNRQNHPLKVSLDTAPFRATGGVAETLISTSLEGASVRGHRAQREDLGIDTDTSDSYNQIDLTGFMKKRLKEKQKRGPDTPAFRLHNMVLNTAGLSPFSSQLIGTYITFRLVDENVNKSLSVVRSGLSKITRQVTYAENYTSNMFRHLMVEFQNHQQLKDFLTSSSQRFVGTVTPLHGIKPEDYETFKSEVIDLFEAHRARLAEAYVKAPVIEKDASAFFADYSNDMDTPEADPKEP